MASSSSSPQSHLPPGFRFHPTDQELILHYLRNRVASIPLPVSIIAEVDIYKFHPWELPEKAAFGDKEWYFFSPRDRKYPNGARPNRAAGSGYWKATGTDKTIAAALPGGGGVTENMGVKKALVFYTGKPPKGVKTNWIMHEYRLLHSNTNTPVNFKHSQSSSSSMTMRLDDWVLCRIYKKSKYAAECPTSEEGAVGELDIAEDQIFASSNINTSPPLPPPPSPPQSSLISQKSMSFSNLLDAMDYSMLSSILCENQSTPPGFGSGNLNPDPQLNTNSSSNYSYSFTPVLLPNMQKQNNMMMNKNNKRQHAVDHEDALYPSKKCLPSSSSCNFSNNTNPQYQNPPWNLVLKQSLLNQQLLLGPHLGFQG